VDVTASLRDLSIRVRALIDTGAPRSIFPRGVGDLLGVEFPTYRLDASKKISFLGRDWAAISETINLHLPPFDDDLGWEAEVDFVMEEQLSLALLGYEGFLNRWAVTFNAAFGYFVIQPAEDNDEAQSEVLMEDLRRRYPELG
jgi:hypothetical protein